MRDENKDGRACDEEEEETSEESDDDEEEDESEETPSAKFPATIPYTEGGTPAAGLNARSNTPTYMKRPSNSRVGSAASVHSQDDRSTVMLDASMSLGDFEEDEHGENGNDDKTQGAKKTVVKDVNEAKDVFEEAHADMNPDKLWQHK